MKQTTILIILFLLGSFSARSQSDMYGYGATHTKLLDDTMNIGRMRLNQPRRIVLGTLPLPHYREFSYSLEPANFQTAIYTRVYDLGGRDSTNVVAVIDNFYPFRYGSDYRGRFYETYYLRAQKRWGGVDARVDDIVLIGEIYQPLAELRWINNYPSRLMLDTLEARQTRTTELEFTNSGESPLRIDVTTTISPSNGLVRLEYPTTEIQPYRTGKVKVSFTAASRGVVNFQVTVQPNSTRPPYRNWQNSSVYNFTGYVRSSTITPPVVTTPPVRSVPTN